MGFKPQISCEKERLRHTDWQFLLLLAYCRKSLQIERQKYLHLYILPNAYLESAKCLIVCYYQFYPRNRFGT